MRYHQWYCRVFQCLFSPRRNVPFVWSSEKRSYFEGEKILLTVLRLGRWNALSTLPWPVFIDQKWCVFIHFVWQTVGAISELWLWIGMMTRLKTTIDDTWIDVKYLNNDSSWAKTRINFHIGWALAQSIGYRCWLINGNRRTVSRCM